MSKFDMIAIYGPALLIVLALVWGGLRIHHLSKKDGVSVLAVMGRRRSPAEIGLAIVAVILDLYLLVRPFWDELDRLAMAVHTPFGHYGVAVMAFGIGLAVLSQIVMGKAWRIGIPAKQEASQSLVTGGLYRFSRNPIYVGIMLFIAGGVIVSPGPITILSFILTGALVGKIIEAEEAFLRQAFGADFDAYCRRVRRWI